MTSVRRVIEHKYIIGEEPWGAICREGFAGACQEYDCSRDECTNGVPDVYHPQCMDIYPFAHCRDIDCLQYATWCCAIRNDWPDAQCMDTFRFACSRSCFSHLGTDYDYVWTMPNCDRCVGPGGACCIEITEDNWICRELTQSGCDADGGTFHAERHCTPSDESPCPIPCCVPDTGECIPGHPYGWCTFRDYIPHPEWSGCIPNLCPAPPQAVCCLCNNQCAEISSEECLAWHGHVMDDVFSCDQNPCAEVNYRARCGGAWFHVSRDRIGDPSRFRPVSADLMDSHDYNDRDDDCVIQWANVSATKRDPWGKCSAWICGQWEHTDPDSLHNTPLRVWRDPSSGRGVFWARYNEACKEYIEN